MEGIDLSDEEDTSTWSVTFRENTEDNMQMTANGYNTEILDHFCNAIVQMIRESLREDVTAEKVGAVVGDAVKSVFEKKQKAEEQAEESNG